MNETIISCIRYLPLGIFVSVLFDVLRLYIMRNKYVDQKMLEMAKVFRMPKDNEIKYILIPALKGSFFSELKYSIILGIMIAIILGLPS